MGEWSFVESFNDCVKLRGSPPMSYLGPSYHGKIPMSSAGPELELLSIVSAPY